MMDDTTRLLHKNTSESSSLNMVRGVCAYQAGVIFHSKGRDSVELSQCLTIFTLDFSTPSVDQNWSTFLCVCVCVCITEGTLMQFTGILFTFKT